MNLAQASRAAADECRLLKAKYPTWRFGFQVFSGINHAGAVIEFLTADPPRGRRTFKAKTPEGLDALVRSL